MTYPAYPLNECPYPVRDNFSSQYGNSFARTEMDDSHNRMRRKFAMLPVSYSLSWHMTFDQFKWFEAFLRYDCAQASGYFTMPLNPVGDPLTLRFTGYPDAAYDTSLGAWVVSGSVEWIRAAPTGLPTGSLPIFPPSLPDPEQTNYSIKRAGTVSRSNITDGLASERARFKDEVALTQLEWDLDADEYAILDDFIHNKLFGGLAPFTGPFANGLGLNQVRINFIDTPKVTPNLSGYTVTGTIEVRDMPIISEFVYRGYGNINLADTIIWNAVAFAEIGTQARESFGYQDSIKFKIGKPASDSISYSDAISLQVNAVRLLNENVTYNDSVISFKISKSPLTEFLVFNTNGQACFEDYASDYVQYGYDALCYQFSLNEQYNEQLTYTETIAFGFSGVRQMTDQMIFTVGGSVNQNQYCATDYVAFGYTADSMATL